MKSVLGAILGLALLASILLLNRQDIPGIGEALRRAPLGLSVSFAVHAMQIVLTALAWRALLPRSTRPGIGTMVLLRWFRESLNALVPAGAIIGQAAAARRLVRHGVPADVAGATATVDMTVEGATQAPFTLVGVLLLLATQSDLHLAWTATIGVLLVTAAAVAMVAAQRNLPVHLAEATLVRLARRWPALPAARLADLQSSVLRLHADRWTLAKASCCHLAAWSLGAVEISGVLYLLGYIVSLRDGFIVESLTQALRSAAFMVPGALGVQEGAILASCSLFGVPPDAALTLALLRRTREVLLGVSGLWAWRRLTPAASAPALTQTFAISAISAEETDRCRRDEGLSLRSAAVPGAARPVHPPAPPPRTSGSSG